jgi:hypothetical protein
MVFIMLGSPRRIKVQAVERREIASSLQNQGGAKFNPRRIQVERLIKLAFNGRRERRSSFNTQNSSPTMAVEGATEVTGYFTACTTSAPFFPARWAPIANRKGLERSACWNPVWCKDNINNGDQKAINSSGAGQGL